MRGTKAQGQTGKLGGGGWPLTSKSRLASSGFSFSTAVLIAGCCFFFLAGFFSSSSLLSQDTSGGVRFTGGLDLRRQLEAEERACEPLPHGKTGDDSFTTIPSQVLSWKPRALYFPNFATEKQCESIIKMARAGLKPSTLALRKGETAESTQGIRTSSGMFISASEDKTGVLDFIEEKIARATSLPRSHGEAFNVLRYEVGQRYNSHYDAFSPSEYGAQKSQRGTRSVNMNESYNRLDRGTNLFAVSRKGKIASTYVDPPHILISWGALCATGMPIPVEYVVNIRNIVQPDRSLLSDPEKNTVASFLLYLSDVEKGGETMFPFENGLNMDGNYDFRECIGLKVKPRQGDGLLFYSLLPNGTIDPTSLHGSCPVIRGPKWVATKWIRDQVQDD